MKVHKSSSSSSSSSSGTFRTVNEPRRGPVTRETVRQLVHEKYLRGVAEIAHKYAKG